MSVASGKTRLFEEYRIPTEGDEELFAMAMMPRHPRRVVFMPPLVGAGAAQAPMTFRNMVKRGCILLSYQYRGHPKCTGIFDLDTTVVDTRYALMWAWNYAKDRGLPLHALTQCYGTVPLLAQFAPGGCGPIVTSISLGSALVSMDQILQIGDFVPILARHLGIKLDLAGMLDGLKAKLFNWRSKPCRMALYEYLMQMFPELRITPESFEDLAYDRTDLESTLYQFLTARYFHRVSVPARIPCHLFLGVRDDMMHLHTDEGREIYENRVRELIPHAVPHYYDIDHFGRGPGREPLIEVMADVCEESEQTLSRKSTVAGAPPMRTENNEVTASVLE